MRAAKIGVLALLVAATMLSGGVSAHAAATTELVSLAADDSPIHAAHFDAISGDGRYVLFDTSKPAVPGDTNRDQDVFVRDRLLGTTERVSVGTGGFQLNGDSLAAAITPDDRYVVFISTAKNLLPRRHRFDWYYNVYVRDLVRDRTQRVSIPRRGARFCNDAGDLDTVQAGAWISNNGRYVAFVAEDCSDTSFTTGAFIRDRKLGVTRELAKTHQNAAPVGASPGLRYIALALDGSVAGRYHHLVIRDRVKSRNIRVEDALPAQKRLYDGLDHVFITAGAKTIVFASKIAYKYDTATATATPILDTSARQRFAIVEGISTDARYVAVVTNLYTASSSDDLYRFDTESSDPPIQADLDSTGTPVDNLWILGMGMSSDAHNIAFTGIYAGPKNGVYLRAGLP